MRGWSSAEPQSNIPTLSTTREVALLTSARPARSKYCANNLLVDVWPSTVPLDATKIMLCPNLTVIHLVDGDEHFTDPVGYREAFCASVDGEYFYRCDNPTGPGSEVHAPIKDPNTLLDRCLPPNTSWEADGHRGAIIRTYSAGDSPPDDIASTLGNLTSEVFTHIRFLSRAIPVGMARPADIKYATSSIGRITHSGIRSERMWIDMSDYCGQWVPRDILDKAYAAAGEAEGAKWLDGKRGGDLGEGWTVLRDWIRSTTSKERAWVPAIDAK